MKKILIFFLVLSFSVYFSSVALADPKSDYDYQYGQYRQFYPEYSLLRMDYLNTPSLDNQQKAILAAKQTIISRDLAKASFTWFLMDLITSSKSNYEPVQPIVSALAASREFFLSEAQKSQSIVTQVDLKNFTASYLNAVLHHDRIVKFGVMGQKIATLVRLQLDMKAALDNLLTKLPATIPATLTARIQELRDSSLYIDTKIDLLTKNLNMVEEEASADAEIFFSSRVEKLIEIRTLQLEWITRLIDIDKNYAQSN